VLAGAEPPARSSSTRAARASSSISCTAEDGVLPDQREGRARVRALATGAACSTRSPTPAASRRGGARRRDARRVGRELAPGARARRRGLDRERTRPGGGEFVQADVFEYLHGTRDRFDSSSSTRRRSCAPARTSMRASAATATSTCRRSGTLAPGGWLFTSSCSQHLSRAAFREVVAAAAADAGRQPVIVAELRPSAGSSRRRARIRGRVPEVVRPAGLTLLGIAPGGARCSNGAMERRDRRDSWRARATPRSAAQDVYGRGAPDARARRRSYDRRRRTPRRARAGAAGGLARLDRLGRLEGSALGGFWPRRAALLPRRARARPSRAGAAARHRQPRARRGSVWAHFRGRLPQLDREAFYVLLLDGKNRVQGEVRVSEGSLTAALVHPREVFAPAIRDGAGRARPRAQPSERRPDTLGGGRGPDGAPAVRWATWWACASSTTSSSAAAAG
jgi:hypothetical protein